MITPSGEQDFKIIVGEGPIIVKTEFRKIVPIDGQYDIFDPQGNPTGESHNRDSGNIKPPIKLQESAPPVSDPGFYNKHTMLTRFNISGLNGADEDYEIVEAIFQANNPTRKIEFLIKGKTNDSVTTEGTRVNFSI